MAIEKQKVQMDKKEENEEEDNSTPGKILFPDKPSPTVPPFLFPQRFRKAKLDGQFATFFNMFKNLEMNIPFAEVLAQMPNYVKLMKEIMSNKKKIGAY